ncbi:MAG: tRNA glutamyl-Q(34) synthetase GluQRS [Pseudohongiellaceae bacterium]
MSETVYTGYTGRFAPSPTGPLHFGSLLAAVASFLDARANQGRWLLRMEDLDPAREPVGAAETILNQLQEFGLHWDGDVLFQSSRTHAYRTALATLTSHRLCFPCDCSRKQVRDMGGIYDGRCRQRALPPSGDYAIRLRAGETLIELEDLIQGPVRHKLAEETGDFVIRRRDGQFAYQLAVVVDDRFQHISHVIRGQDLLESTPRQIYLQRLLGYPTPCYGHIPIIVDASGDKLSKQRFADPIDVSARQELIHRALVCLGQPVPAAYRALPVSRQLEWAIAHWDIQAVPKLATMPLI